MCARLWNLLRFAEWIMFTRCGISNAIAFKCDYIEQNNNDKLL